VTEEGMPSGPAEAPDAEISTPGDAPVSEGTVTEIRDERAEREARERAEAASRAILSRIRIQGFKSFAEPTTVEVQPGLTGIVGPNGCGKSNVVEALRWAMGETSAKSLRGGEMDDVIFAGTATRPGRNLAEVQLHLEEAAGLAPPPNREAMELEITRRITRGEGSAFRVNGKEVRARDVQTMFADIGSGARASAMVSQGRVAMLIQAKPDDRRQVLEEAAGISGLRARRHEAELKLRQAENNLTRSEDLLGQLDVQKGSLQRQARQANRYRNLSGLVRAAEADFLALLRARATRALGDARAAYDAAKIATRQAEEAATAAAIRTHEAEQALPAPREAEAAARTALERRRVEHEGLEQEEARARAALDAATLRLMQLDEDLGHAEKREADAAAAQERLADEEQSLAATAAGLPARREEAQARAVEAEEAARAAERAAEAATERAAEAAAEAQRVAQSLAAAEARLRRAAEQQARLEQARAEASSRRIAPESRAAARAAMSGADERHQAAQIAFAAAEMRRADAARDHTERRRAAAEAAAEAQRAAAAEAAAAERLKRIAAQHATLAAEHARAEQARVPAEQLEAARNEANFATATLDNARARLEAAEAARAAAAAAHAEARQAAAEADAARARAAAEARALAELLAARETGEAAPILDMVVVPPGLEAALGAALGEALDGAADTTAARHWRALPPLDHPPALPGGATPLSRLVEAPSALGRALSQIGLLPREADGAALQAALLPGQALVTEDGALWRWDGHTLRAGTPTPGVVRLRQRNALRAAEARLDRAEADSAAATSARNAAAQAESNAAGTEAAAREARRQAEATLQEVRGREAALAARAAEAESRISALAPQLQRLATERSEADAAVAAAEAARAALPDLAALSAAAEGAAVEEADAQRAEAGAREARRQAEAELARARQAESQLAAQAAEVESRLSALEPQIAAVATEREEAEHALESLRETQAALPDLDALRQAVEQARATLAEARTAERAAQAEVSALTAEGERIARRRADAAGEIEGWQERRAEAAQRLEDYRARRTEAAAEQERLAEIPEDVARRRNAAGSLLAEVEAAHNAAVAALTAAEREARDAVRGQRDADAAFAGAREGQIRCEGAAEAAEAAAASVEERILERLGEGAELPPPGEDLSDGAEEKARKKVERLTREREEMGPVNLRADVEMTEVETRIAQITTERDEITTAIAKLRGSIGHLNREGRDRLREVFDRVDTEFRALFTKLFGGGRAHLALVGSDDPLEAGLEIYAEPPGKKLATLSLLSGGEQALTALSLIFAVFRCHPAPICVLDEVDAPLDDANVERLCDLLDGMAAESGTRFLVVTHHPLTMARMHRLYGVTMQERGVSRLLSVDLGQAVAMAEGPPAG